MTFSSVVILMTQENMARVRQTIKHLKACLFLKVPFIVEDLARLQASACYMFNNGEKNIMMGRHEEKEAKCVVKGKYMSYV